MKTKSSRRALISGASVFAAAALGRVGTAAPRSRAQREPVVNVRDFGARGDGRSDDSVAVGRALKDVGEGGGVVALPQGNYLLSEPIDVPAQTTVEGVFRSPSARSQYKGTTLICGQAGGDPDGTPFVTLHAGATLKGLAIYYPEQRRAIAPLPYPWTVRGVGDNCTLLDVLLVNPYQGVDLGMHPCGRHYIRGLYGQPLRRGLLIDQCFDVGRVENVHFWPFWEAEAPAVLDFVRAQGEAFIVGRTDWEYLDNCFCLGYRVGYHFVATPAGTPNALLTQCGADLGPTAVRVDGSQEHAGVSFVNGQFMAGIEVGSENRGPLKFTACGFWGVETTGAHAVLDGRGHTTFVGCHFTDWGRGDPDAPAIDLRRGGLSVSACDFQAAGRKQLRLAREGDTAIIVGNRFRGAELVENDLGSKAQIGLNAATPSGPASQAQAKPRARLFARALSRWRA